MQRVLVYVDGFNLYFGLRSQGLKRFYWLDLPALATAILQQQQQLEMVKYFTARIDNPAATRERQNDYIEALLTRQKLQIYYGQYQSSPRTCHHCHTQTMISQEKMTDVNIAVELLEDAFQDRFDTALLMSGDSDLVPPVRAVKRLFPKKRVVAVFPPGRSSRALKQHADAFFVLGRAKIAASQLPDKIQKPDGVILERPSQWK